MIYKEALFVRNHPLSIRTVIHERDNPLYRKQHHFKKEITMRMKLITAVVCCATILIGCMAKQPVQPIATQPLEARNYRPKADTVLFILDASSSMEWLQQSHTKFDIATALTTGMINTIPDMDMDAGLISFGHSSVISDRKSMVLTTPARFDRKALLDGLGRIGKGGGVSQLHTAIDTASEFLKDREGKKVLIIISDGNDMGEQPLKSAQALKEACNAEICIHTIQIGASVPGAQLLKALSETTNCGTARTADSLQSGAQLTAFVKEVLLEKGVDSDGDGVMDDMDQCPATLAGAVVDATGCPLDSDGDGVYDGLDQCPGTPAGIAVNVNGCARDDDGDGVPNSLDACPATPTGIQVDGKGCPLDSDGDGIADYLDRCPGTDAGIKVDRNGCPIPAADGAEVTAAGTWIFDDVQFESGKNSLKAGSSESLDKVAQLLKENPDLKLEIQGHTDNTGNSAFNYRLSEKRANAVKAYLIESGIAVSRLSAKGYGPSKPIADNGTIEGRAKNRRVEFNPF